MPADTTWQPLLDELDRWRRAGRIADFWLRDDDAVEPTASLDRLLGLTADFAVPLTLAVIPAHTGLALAARLEAAPTVSVALHGWSHENHAPAGQKKQELGPHRPRAEIHGALSAGLSRLAELHGPRLVPMLVPPWNRIDPALIADLPGLGFAALSVFGRAKPAPLAIVNSTVDLIDWHGTRGCRDHGALVGEIVDELGAAFAGQGAPTGVLGHHLVHDDSAWQFLQGLFEVTARHNACRWRTAGDLIAAVQTGS